MNPAQVARLAALTLVCSTAAVAAETTPAPTLRSPSVGAEVGSARSGLEVAVAEIDACCQGQLEKASFAAQRRWAVSLYRWLVLTRCKPSPEGFSAQERFEAQAHRTSSAYAAVVAAHREDWLEANRDRLPPPTAAAKQSSLQFFEGLCVLGIFEQELRRAIDRRDALVRTADRELEASRRSVLEDMSWAQEMLAAAQAKGRRFDYIEAFRKQREGLAAQIKECEARIQAIQDQNASYQTKWQERYGRLAYGTLEFQRAIGEYRRTVNEDNDKINVIADELTELQRRFDRLGGSIGEGPLARDLEDLDLPPAARPVAPAEDPPPQASPALERP